MKTEFTNPLLTNPDHSQRIKDQTYHVAHNGHHHRSETSRVMMSHGDLALNIQQIGVKKKCSNPLKLAPEDDQSTVRSLLNRTFDLPEQQ